MCILLAAGLFFLLLSLLYVYLCVAPRTPPLPLSWLSPRESRRAYAAFWPWSGKRPMTRSRIVQVLSCLVGPCCGMRRPLTASSPSMSSPRLCCKLMLGSRVPFASERTEPRKCSICPTGRATREKAGLLKPQILFKYIYIERERKKKLTLSSRECSRLSILVSSETWFLKSRFFSLDFPPSAAALTLLVLFPLLLSRFSSSLTWVARV